MYLFGIVHLRSIVKMYSEPRSANIIYLVYVIVCLGILYMLSWHLIDRRNPSMKALFIYFLTVIIRSAKWMKISILWDLREILNYINEWMNSTINSLYCNKQLGIVKLTQTITKREKNYTIKKHNNNCKTN